MQQRRLRLGDILDDYCPRERRVTNHVVLAMIDDAVKQTRCTTCDADHEYKQGKTPAPRRRKAAGVLFADAPDGTDPRPVLTTAHPSDDLDSDQASDDVDLAAGEAGAAPADVADAEFADADDHEEHDEPEEDDARAAQDDDGPVHRRLIRATLPRPEGQTPERREPEFTIRQPGGRGFDGNRNGQQGRGGQRGMRGQMGQGGPARFGGGQRQGQGQGQGSGQGQRQSPGNRRPAGGGQSRGPSRGGQGRKRGR